MRNNLPGMLASLVIALPAWILGQIFPVIGGAVIAILAGMIISIFWKDKGKADSGIRFVSKQILQLAVILLGFGMDLTVVLQTGKQSLPIIVCTITTALLAAYAVCRILHVPSRTATLIGVGSSICGGSAIAATAPVIDADDEEVAQSISVIFFFNVLAALLFPALGRLIGFDTASGTAFGIFAGTAINDTSSVTAAASTWDSMWGLGTATLDTAVTVKLTRTLAIIPITLVLALMRSRSRGSGGGKVSLRKIFPFFILLFVAAALITTLAVSAGVPSSAFSSFKTLSRFLIVLAMAAIGLNTDVIRLVRTGGKPLILGAVCWGSITVVSLALQSVMGLI